MPTLFIHSGLHKTGTTSLQKALYDNRAELARQGLLYPLTGIPDNPAHWGHHDLAYALRDREKAEEIWSKLRGEADNTGHNRVVISSEELGLLPFPLLPGPKPYQIIAQAFKGWEIRLICYLRPQAEMITSVYNHHVKSVGEYGHILDFIARIAGRLDYHHYLNVAAAGLGQEAIFVRRYQKARMVEGDIIADMAAQIGLDLNKKFKRPVKPLNRGLTPAGLEAMLEANRRYQDQPAALSAERRRILARHSASTFQKYDLLGPDVRRAIDALYRQQNRHVARRFLKEDADLFVPEHCAV